MKPVLGKAATSAPRAASFQRMRGFRLAQTTPPTTASPTSSQTSSTCTSSSWAMGVLAPNRYSMAGRAKNRTKPFSPGMASSGSARRRAAK